MVVNFQQRGLMIKTTSWSSKQRPSSDDTSLRLDQNASRVKRRRAESNSAPGPSFYCPATIGGPAVPVAAASASASRCQAAGQPNDQDNRPLPASPTSCPIWFVDSSVITRPHNFLGSGRAACDDNIALRLIKYKKNIGT